MPTDPLLGTLRSMPAALLSRCPKIQASPISQSLQFDLGFTSTALLHSLSEPPSKDSLVTTHCLASAALRNHGARLHDSFSSTAFMPVEPGGHRKRCQVCCQLRMEPGSLEPRLHLFLGADPGETFCQVVTFKRQGTSAAPSCILSSGFLPPQVGTIGERGLP